MMCSLLLLICCALCVFPATSQNVSFIGQMPFISYISAGAVKDSHVYHLMAHGVSSFSLQSDNVEDLSFFKISSEDTIQIAKAPLPQQSLFVLLITASHGSESVSSNLTVNVLPTTETEPIFEHDTYSVSLAENGEINEFVAFTQAFSLSVTTVTSYLIINGNTDGAFAINGSTGVISTTKSLNREAVSHYQLSVSYIDESSSAYATVNVVVSDKNDNFPVFSQSLYIFEVNESSSSYLTIGKLTASDLDIDKNGVITFSIVDDDYKNLFFVKSDGDIVANVSLDYEKVKQYMFQVVAVDNGEIAKSTVTTVFIKIGNTDDECPLYSNSNSIYVKDIPYNPLNPPVIGVILTVSATDPDNLGVVTYDILSGNDMGLFAINSSSGNISLVKIDDSLIGQYVLMVVADDLSCFNTSIARVEIAIGNSNKNTPKFTSESCSAVLFENPLVGTSVAVLQATDNDVGTFGQITYEIVNNFGDFLLFTINPQTGNITTTGSPGNYDREKKSTLSLGVTATDGGFFQDFCLLSITLIDVNDNFPTFDGDEYEISITSNVEYVLEIEAHDPDFGPNGAVSYSLQAAHGTIPNNCPFIIDKDSGVITVANESLINEDLCTMVVTASDNGDPPLHSTVFVNISIVNNQQIPEFDKHFYSVNITENFPTSVPVVTVMANTFPNNTDTIVYTIKKGSEYRTNSNNTFSIQGGGIIEVNTQSLPDYESLYPGPYSFRLLVAAKASASGANSLAIVEINVVDLNDNSPVFVGNDDAVITLTVVEERMKGTIGVIKATDADIGSYGIVEYSFVPTGFSIGQNVFTIDPNGTVELLVDNLDAEDPSTLPSYEFFITATNPLPPNNTRTGTVHLEIIIQDINDSPPSFENATYHKSLLESHPLTTVLDLSANDPDTTSSLKYNILSGNEGATFQIDSDKGELKLKRPLDYESIQQYSLIVEVSDGVFQETATVTIAVLNIDDEAPVFLNNLYTAVVVENAPIDTSLLTVTATDVDSEVIAYEIKGQGVNRFVIDSEGVIKVSGNIDREEFLPTAQIVFLVFAYGGSLGTTSVHINITDVNDYVPHFILSPYFGTAPENTSPGLNGLYIVTVKALDFDEGQNGSVKYSVISGEEKGFRVDSATGIVTGIVMFDREEQRFYTLIIQAIDHGTPIQLFSTVEVIVEISDYNDNPPFWPYPYMFARVYEHAQIGKTVIKLPANDPDNGVNSSIIFNIVGGNSMNKFTLDSNTGEIKVGASLDYENILDRRHFIYVSIKDNGNPQLEGASIGELEIHVLDSNDHQPTFIDPSLLIVLEEDTSTGALVSVFTAIDNDSFANGEINYAIVKGNAFKTFSLTKHSNGSGLLYLENVLDYETISVYQLTIQVFDNGYPVESSSVVVTILINDINDEMPKFTENIYYGFVSENIPSATSVLQVLAIDHDSDTIPGGQVYQYQLMNNNDDFTLNESWIIAAANLDREVVNEYTLTVIAIDDDSINPQSGTATVIVTVVDVNDNPSVSGGIKDIVILAHNGVFTGSELDVPYFIDPDDNDTFIDCQIQSGDDHIFEVQSSNCAISILDVTLFQASNTFTLVVQGNDGLHSPVLATVHISVVYVYDHSLLLTVSTTATAQHFLDVIYPSIHAQLSLTTGVAINIFSVNVVEEQIVMALTSENTTLTSVIQSLFISKDFLPFDIYSIPVDPCANEPCFNNGECVTTFGIPIGYLSNKVSSQQRIIFSPVVSIGYQCNCIPGTTGGLCEINYDDCYSSPCLYEARCIDGYQAYTCECPSGTSGKNCGINPDECITDQSCLNGGTCINGFSDFICSCPTNFYGDRCQYAYFLPSNFCDTNPCLNEGTCSPGRDSYSCLCTEDFTGDNCERQIQFQGGCVNNPCFNGSTCIETPLGFTCECSIGFTGPLCRFPLNNCELEYCRNGAFCEVGLYGAYLCKCDEHYLGVNCTDEVLQCTKQKCYNGGTCVNNGTNNFYCLCDKEHYGTLCQYDVEPINLCNDNQLCNSKNSSCSPGQGTFTCVCTNESGYGGEYCTVKIIPTPCSSNPCLHGGNCSMINNGFTCSCPKGYTGTFCETDINECFPEQCENGATCLNGFGSYLCLCVNGFAGRHCEVECPLGQIGEKCEVNVNMCLNYPCENGGSCQTQYGSYFCSCLSNFTGDQCEIPNDCTHNSCVNGGTCRNDSIEGYSCDCETTENIGEHCELTTVGFSGSENISSYRAYNTLGFRAKGQIKLEFATQSTNGLLLLVTQFQKGRSLDFIAIEIQNNLLYIKYSRGDEVNYLEVTSSSGPVTDGDWHNVVIEIDVEEVHVLLDYCTTINDDTQLVDDCNYQVVSNGSLRYIDANLPVWLGGAPIKPPEIPLNSIGSNSCIRNVVINSKKLDLQSYVDEQNSTNGCQQITRSCNNIDCGNGTCVPEWNKFYCDCPPRLTGVSCSTNIASVTYNGKTYSQFTLLDTFISNQKSAVFPTLLNGYEERISLWFRTELSGGILLLLGNFNKDYLVIKLSSSGNILYSIKFGSNLPYSVMLPMVSTNSKWHYLSVSRKGLTIRIKYDENYDNEFVLRGSDVILSYYLNEMYVAGMQAENNGVSDGYIGCIQDVRFNGKSLPSFGFNTIASVKFVGDDPQEGCKVGVCFPNPCGEMGFCSEIDDESYKCNCTNGDMVIQSSCDWIRSSSPWSPILAILVSLGLFIIILMIALVIGLAIVYKRVLNWNKTESATARLNNICQPINSVEDYEIHENVYRYDCEDGEDDTSATLYRSSESLIEMKTTGPVMKASSFPPNITTFENLFSQPQKNEPKSFTHQSQDVNAYIESRVNDANKTLLDVDSVTCYSDEGGISGSSSLSSIGLHTCYEPYTVTRLKLAGPEFQRITEFLEPVLMESTSMVDDFGRSEQCAL